MDYIRKIKIVVYFHAGRYCVTRRDLNTPHKGLAVIFYVIGSISLRQKELLGHVYDRQGSVVRPVILDNSKPRDGMWDEVVCDEASRRGISHLENMKKPIRRLQRTG